MKWYHKVLQFIKTFKVQVSITSLVIDIILLIAFKGLQKGEEHDQ